MNCSRRMQCLNLTDGMGDPRYKGLVLYHTSVASASWRYPFFPSLLFSCPVVAPVCVLASCSRTAGLVGVVRLSGGSPSGS